MKWLEQNQIRRKPGDALERDAADVAGHIERLDVRTERPNSTAWSSPPIPGIARTVIAKSTRSWAYCMTDKAFMPPPGSKTEKAAAEQVRDAPHGRVVLHHWCRRLRLPAHGTTRFEILKIPRNYTENSYLF
jgi:hypothetical protein